MTSEEFDTMDTGFRRHASIPVDAEGEVSQFARGYAAKLFGPDLTEKWFDVTGLGFGKDWLYVVGI